MTRQNLRMLIDNEFDSADLSLGTGSAIPTLPLEHMQRYSNSRSFGSTDVNQVVINGNLTHLAVLNGFVAYRHNLSNAAQWRLELFDNINQSGKKVFDSGLINALPTKTLADLNFYVDKLVSSIADDWHIRYSQMWFESVMAQSFRLTIEDPEQETELVEINRCYLGQAFQPEINFDWGYSHAWESSGQHRRSAGGSIHTHESELYRRIKYRLSWVSPVERPKLSYGIRAAGLRRDIFISLFPNAGGQTELEYAMACKFTSLPPITSDFINNNSVDFEMEEC